MKANKDKLLISSIIASLLGTSFLAFAVPNQDQFIGAPSLYTTDYADTLLDIATRYDLGFIELRAANPDIDPWLPGNGNILRLPTEHILPSTSHRGIVINLPELRLYYYPPDGSPPLSFPIGIGGAGKETPTGTTKVVRKQVHPAWIPTASERAENASLPAIVQPGADNPMGDYALYLAWTDYAIHGSNRSDSIGRRDSHGCIRMYANDIERLFKMVKVDTLVTIVNQPVKFGWRSGNLYMEVHADQSDAEAIEDTGEPISKPDTHIDDLVRTIVDNDDARLNWLAIHEAETQRNGIPVQITLPYQPTISP